MKVIDKTDAPLDSIKIGTVFEGSLFNGETKEVFLRTSEGMVSLTNPRRTWSNTNTHIRSYRKLGNDPLALMTLPVRPKPMVGTDIAVGAFRGVIDGLRGFFLCSAYGIVNLANPLQCWPLTVTVYEFEPVQIDFTATLP